MMLYNICSMTHATLTAIIIAICYFTGISSARLVRAEEMELRFNTVAGARSN
jgi:ABC-type dipeptide/oligopeptide/nickel transport system permease subunit